jgi:hypothetical protein
MNQKVKSCDSCNFAEKTNSLTYPVKCTISKPIPMMVHEYCVNWFAYVGCASHSDYQSEGDTISKELALELCIDARKDVRDKVLDDFACWIKTEWVQESIKDYKADKPCK